MSWSRYHREFDEIEFIAGGGFGRVYKARNKLDGIEYAVKKVTIKYRTIKRVLTHLAEVKTFASLNHMNIVPYKAAWLEPIFDNNTINQQNAIQTKRMQRKNLQKNVSKVKPIAFHSEAKAGNITIENDDDVDEDESYMDTGSSDTDDDLNPDKILQTRKNLMNIVENDESSDFIQFKHEDVVDGANFSRADSAKEKSHSKHQKALCKLAKLKKNLPNDNLEFNELQSNLKLRWATLYIQMSFRPLTLRAWLDERKKYSDFNKFYKKFIENAVEQLETKVDNDDAINQNASTSTSILNGKVRQARRRTSSSAALEKNLSKTWDALDVTINIFTQALSGLKYIHLQNIVHHDIKPSNIFIDCDKTGELYVQLGDFGLACPLHTKHSPDAMIGTPTYAALEQLNGQCNPKV